MGAQNIKFGEGRMIPFYTEVLNRLHELHNEIEKAIEGLPQEALDWKPGPAMNSICVLVVHLSGAERFLIGDIVKGEPSQRNRPAEFMAAGWEAAALVKRLRDAEAYFKSVLESMSLEDLGGERRHPRDGSQVSVSWAILHALEHTALHTGQIQDLRQLYQDGMR
jgi:uncharacterized damage-inducible protein DinB